MEKLSATIITFNEEENISGCIDSLWQVADEIIVLDSFSTDRTLSIAINKGAIVKQAAFIGYIEQKNLALSFCQHNFVLSLDADERISKKLARSILAAKRNFRSPAYFMNRYNRYCGKFINHGLWYPNRKIRLFDKRIAKWGGANPHDKIIIPSDTHCGFLKGDILHFAYETFKDHKMRNEEISSIAARSLLTSGKHVPWWKIILSPAWSFLHGYIIRLGFLDGYPGLVIAFMTANQSFLKYNKLRILRQQEKERISTSTILNIIE
jgi:glycosyltransferase involved in cell wall biosynthesis